VPRIGSSLYEVGLRLQGALIWNNFVAKLKLGRQLLTPGRGIPANRQTPFFITGIAPTHIGVEIDKSRTPNCLPKPMFDAVDTFFQHNPIRFLRIATEDAVIPAVDIVDEIAQAAAFFSRAIGNYAVII
jgi:hypothetical protein